MFDFTLGNECSEEANPNGNTHPRRKAPFHAQFTFSVLKDKELIFFRVTPPATGPSSSFAQSVRANPKWSEVQITQAAKGAGAIYGPENKNQFLTAIPIEELKAYIGESKVESAQFYAHRPEGPSGSVDIVDYPICIWNVEVTSHLASGAEHHYLLLFDAFGGKLFNISWTGH